MNEQPTEKNLHLAHHVLLARCPNGWTAKNYHQGSSDGPSFAFESTESLARQLVRLLGKSGWHVEQSRERDEKGHFIKLAK